MRQLGVDDDRSGITILVVEDNSALNSLFQSYLSRQKFHVVSALSFDAARLILASETTIDIALINYDLGDYKGIELISYFPKNESKKNIPVIMLGTSQDQAVLQACFKLGVDDYLLKPVNPTLLSLKIDSLVYNMRLTNIIAEQNEKLQRLINNAEIEEQLASHIFYNNLLSQKTQTVAGFTHFLQSTSGFSGDIILARYAPCGSIFILHADATGHGLSSTITLMPMVSIFKTMVHKGYRLEPIVREMNSRLIEQLPADRFVAASLIEIDINHGDLKVWNGGMPEILLLDDTHQVTHRFHSSHMALGILEDAQFEVRAIHWKLPEKGLLFGFSDGVVEQEDSFGRAFGIEGVLQIVKRKPADMLNTIASTMDRHVGSSSLDDDASMYELHFDQLRDDPGTMTRGSQALAQDMNDLSPFEWSLELVGTQIAKQELPSMCNQFLSTMGFAQSVCQRSFTIISELVNNAIDHGLLELTSLLKLGPEGFMAYYLEREKRIASLTQQDVLRLVLTWGSDALGPYLHIDVKDSGKGYLPDNMAVNDAMEYTFGRGITLIKQLATAVEIRERGTFVRAELR
ncbi:fused response regulator/phosphatase [Nitrincola iocasae]|uniref:Fused response regulator/phosphatase n=1 Tax=Nitrincola iocasae TaxID=2614693 RepID=A0A5J6LCT2_9GAMM|nr:fused response regulator/phosphatase [Nitrincola iocasae]QEW06128.1 fused response regulator/phosphatase [Nitrincola iocasae]